MRGQVYFSWINFGVLSYSKVNYKPFKTKSQTLESICEDMNALNQPSVQDSQYVYIKEIRQPVFSTY